MMKTWCHKFATLFALALIPGLAVVGPPAAAAEDVDPPVVSDVSVPDSVVAEESVTVTWRVTDASGVQWPYAQVTGPTGLHLSCAMAEMTGGSATDGTWSQICPVHEASSNGTYSVWINTTDVVGNDRVREWVDGALVPDATFTVTGGGGDVDPPVVSEVVAVPASVVAGESVTLTWQVTDATGVPWLSPQVIGPAGGLYHGCGMPQMTAGSVTDGTWSQICPIYEASPNGTYAVWIAAFDVVGNDRVREYVEGALVPDATFTVTGGAGDVDPPVVSEVVAVPASVVAGESVTVTWRVTDTTGVFGSGAQVISATERSLGCGMPRMTAGSVTDSTWSQICLINEASPNGTYSVWIPTEDLLGNNRVREWVDGAFESDATFTVTGAAPTASVKVKAKNHKSKLFVNVNPNKGKGYWKFKVQKQRASGSWKSLKTYRTKGKKETRKINLKEGTYRVKVKPKYGYQGVTSSSIYLKR